MRTECLLAVSLQATTFGCASAADGSSTPLPPRTRAPALPPHQYHVDVRTQPKPGGGAGWISSNNVEALSAAAVELEKASPGDRRRIIYRAFAANKGRFPDDMRNALATLAASTSEQQPTKAAILITRHEPLFADLCGDLNGTFRRANTLPAEKRAEFINTECDLARFGLISADARADLTVLPHGLLLHLQRLGGPHPVEEALLYSALNLQAADHQTSAFEAPPITTGPLAGCQMVVPTRSVWSTGPVTIEHRGCDGMVANVATYRGVSALLPAAVDSFERDFVGGLAAIEAGSPRPTEIEVGGAKRAATAFNASDLLNGSMRGAVVKVVEPDAAFVLVCIAPTAEYESRCPTTYEALLARGPQLP